MNSKYMILGFKNQETIDKVMKTIRENMGKEGIFFWCGCDDEDRLCAEAEELRGSL